MDSSKKLERYFPTIVTAVVFLIIGAVFSQGFGLREDPLQESDFISDLFARVDALEVENEEQENYIRSTREYAMSHSHKFSDLTGEPVSPVGILNEPAFDSGWLSIEVGEIMDIEHGLGTTEILVYMVGRNRLNHVHQKDYGSDDWRISNGDLMRNGASWAAREENFIEVHRLQEDGLWEEVRVLIWKLPPPPS